MKLSVAVFLTIFIHQVALALETSPEALLARSLALKQTYEEKLGEFDSKFTFSAIHKKEKDKKIVESRVTAATVRHDTNKGIMYDPLQILSSAGDPKTVLRVVDRVFNEFIDKDVKSFIKKNKQKGDINADNYIFTYSGMDTMERQTLYRYTLKPKKNDTGLFANGSYLWIDADSALPYAIQGRIIVKGLATIIVDNITTTTHYGVFDYNGLKIAQVISVDSNLKIKHILDDEVIYHVDVTYPF